MDKSINAKDQKCDKMEMNLPKPKSDKKRMKLSQIMPQNKSSSVTTY